MAEFIAFRPDVEIYGAVALSIVEGMGEFRSLGYTILARHGVLSPQPDRWYPQQQWLDAFRTIAEKIGPRTLFAIGKKILDAVEWPPGLDTIEKGLASIDLNYHLRHRIDGVPLWNPETGEMREGIGHYRFSGIVAEGTAMMVCENPYPSEFDRGIITAMGRRYLPQLEVTLDPDRPTRQTGANSCTFQIRETPAP